MAKAEIRLHLEDNFSGRLALAAAAVEAMHLDWCLSQATWEPHDWRAFGGTP